MIEEVKSFRTPDGQFFASKQEAMIHMHRKAYLERAEAFAEAKGLEGASKTRAINIIADYCAFEELEEVKEAA